MKKLTSLLAIASLAVALTGASALACEKTCSDSKSTATATAASATNVSAKSGCNASKTDATLINASADNCNPGDCALSSGKFAVAVMNVDGMTCGGCENKLTMAFEKADGVIWVAAVSHSDGVAKVIFDKSITKADDMVRLVSETGYKAEIMTAVATTTVDADASDKLVKTGKAGCTAAEKAACASKASATTASADKAACSSKGASKAGVTTASADHCKSSGSECSKLTSAERAGFCAKYCKSETEDSKKDI